MPSAAATVEPRGQSKDHSLIAAARAFARDDRARSWRYVAITFSTIAAALTVAVVAPWWPVRLVAGLVAGLVMGRGFIIYHDHMHGALLRKSRVGAALIRGLGIFMLAPPRSWAASHNYHHAHVGQIEASHVGSFRIMTARAWRDASFGTRAYYRVVRSPLTILFAYPAVFLWSITAAPLFRKPLQHWDSAVALLLHAGIITVAWWFGGAATACFAVFVPFATAGTLGAYLFYAQHNFPGMRVVPPDAWTLQRSALESCSYLRLGPVMSWFTGDIGYHHVHHLNAAIPFYRLHEAMQAIPGLQHPIETSLRLRDIVACLRLKLWDEERQQMVGFPKAKQTS